ncbi:hypothetical protein [Synechococcus sp. WH 8016]|uniref:hypothetical protein n=1 Tax=Synechococcus sp. WH 8016 TaxID=166318 RepID=UPI00022DA14F|nr:hypothetical protein [Synechococcus sp. WH 8016]EHA63727.1 hypothetical protein Syn8016DRAFT_0768 [Synechococcus sp. WH 8016]
MTTLQMLQYPDLTDAEKAVVDAQLSDHGEGFEIHRINSELFYADEYTTWSVQIPSEHEELYPDLFADQDVGCTDPATITKSRLLGLTVDLADDDDAALKIIAEDYLGVKYEHITDITVATW